MKTLAVVLASALAASAAPPAPPPIDYPMRNIPVTDARFAKVHAAVLEDINNKLQRSTLTVKVNQVLDANRLLCINLDSYVIFLLKFKNHNATDGARISCNLRSTDEVFEYVSVLGAKHTVRVFSADPEKQPVTKEEFVTFLQSGKTYVIKYGEAKTKCDACDGVGWLRQEGKITGNGRKDCKPCRGLGKISMPQRIVVKW